jgi:hypothetical protein
MNCERLLSSTSRRAQSQRSLTDVKYDRRDALQVDEPHGDFPED